MSSIHSQINFMNDEKIVAEVEAQLWATSSNAIARFIGRVLRFIAMLLGTRVRFHLIITNKRIIEVSETIQCYCFTTKRLVRYVTPSSVKQVGYSKATNCGICCSAYYLFYNSQTQYTNIMVNTSNESMVRDIVEEFYRLISDKQ